jgi:hypothetical protein
MKGEHMYKKMGIYVLAALTLSSVYGCALLVAGAAGGAGTAAWLSGKLTQEFNSSYDNTVAASRKALESMALPIKKESHTETVTQLRSEDTNGKDIWIDVHKIDGDSSKVEVRVGGVEPDKEASSNILERIKQNL